MSRAFSAVLPAALSFVIATGFLGISAYGSVDPGWQSEFNLDECDLSPTGVNDYFYLVPGYQLTLEGDEDGKNVQLIMTVLNETRVVDGIETRVVEEHESVDGELAEISRNFFAMCTSTGDIFYFGEEVDIYEAGVVVEHEGAWLAGEDNARAGLIIPANPVVGMKYYQEVAPGVAEDKAEIISLNEIVLTPAGTFDNVLKVEETNPLEGNEKEFKFHAPGIGLIQDADLKLKEYVLPEVEPDEPELTSQDQSVTVEDNTIEVGVNSSSTISEFALEEQAKALSFTVDGEEGTEGITTIAIGRVLEGPYTVTIDGEPTTDFAISGTSEESVISISYTHGIENITITGTNVVPEFPTTAMAAIAASVGTVALLGRSKFKNGIG